MLRKSFLFISLVFVLSLLLTACGAEKPKVYKVAISYMPGAFSPVIDGFKAKMTELGYVEGQNITYEYQEVPTFATKDEILAMVKKFVDAKVDLIVAFPTPVMIAAHAATQGTNIPVIFVMSNPETLKLIKSVREPGGNMTGVRYPGAEIQAKRLEILIKIAPQVKRVWVGYDKNHPNAPSGLEAVRSAASSLGLTLVEVPATTLKDFEADFTERAKSADLGVDAMITLSDGLTQGPEGYTMINKFAAEHKIPLCTGGLSFVEQGGLFGNAASFLEAGKLAAPLADKIFKGTPAGEISVITPEQELYINYKVAQELGLTVPETLLKQAVKVIR